MYVRWQQLGSSSERAKTRAKSHFGVAVCSCGLPKQEYGISTILSVGMLFTLGNDLRVGE